MSQHDAPIAYLARTRAWYLALGYDTPYVWARHDDAPFFAPDKPLTATTVALVTTAAPYRPEHGDQGPGAPYNAAAKFWQVYSGDSAIDHDLRIAHVAIDRQHTTMRDSACWFPLPRLRALAARGLLRLAPRFHGFPTNRSQRQTTEVDAPELLARCRADGVEAALLVANCPVCHQSLALAARHLEAHGIATVVLGCARDVVEQVGVSRFLFSDFPLGNAAGRPDDPLSQELTLLLALNLLGEAAAPRTTWQSPLRWPGPVDWKLDYANPERIAADQLARLRDEAEADRQAARAQREATLGQTDQPAFCSL